MSCEIKNGKHIKLTRGDSMYLSYFLNYKDGTPYEYHEGDTARFAMKENIKDPTEEPKLLIPMTINPEDNSVNLYMRPEDSKPFEFNKTFDYDIELTYLNPRTGNVDIDTFVTKATIRFTPEVV